MNFFQKLMIAIFLPRKASPSVRYQLSPAQQNRVVRQCEEINALIQEVHVNLSDIRHAGSVTSRVAHETHHKQLQGRQTLRQQQKECERINGELRKISEEMRAVRKNLTLTSRRGFATMNRARDLDHRVKAMSAPAKTGDSSPEMRSPKAVSLNSVGVDYSN